MQGLILAAGRGTRLGSLTNRVPKCMLSLNGRPLIELMLECLITAGVDRAVLVVGHGADALQALLGDRYRDLPIHYVINPLYAETNNMYSVLLAGAYLAADDTLLIESDMVVEQSIVAACLADPAPNIAVVAKYQRWMDGTVVVLDEAGRVSRILPKREHDPAQFEQYWKTVNLYKLARGFCHNFFLPAIHAHIDSHGAHSFYEEAFAPLIGMPGCSLRAVDVRSSRWFEIDTPDDLARAAALFASLEPAALPAGAA